MSNAYQEDLAIFDQSTEYFSEFRIAHGAGGAGGTLAEFAMRHKAVLTAGVLTNTSIRNKKKPCTLNDGSKAEYSHGHYGLGLKMKNINGIPVYSHGGAINGFVSDAIYAPSLDVTVVFATNTWKNPIEFRGELLELVLNNKFI